MMNKFWKALLRPRVWIAELLIVVFFVTFFVLGFLGYLEPIREFLNSDLLSFKVGETTFSAYLILKTVTIIIALFWVTGIILQFLENKVRRMKRVKKRNKALIIKLLQILLYFIAFILCLDVIGIDLTTLTVFSGAIGIGLGFGLQKITSNFISGLILLFEKSAKHDDLVELSDGMCGFIRRMSARYTLVETFEGKEIMVPNEDFITSRVINWSYSNKKGMVELSLGVSYECDIEKARKIILKAVDENKECMKKPEPECYLTEFADSSINFLIHFWVPDMTTSSGRYGVKSDVIRSIWKKFKENNIKIPYPQRDVHIKDGK